MLFDSSTHSLLGWVVLLSVLRVSMGDGRPCKSIMGDPYVKCRQLVVTDKILLMQMSVSVGRRRKLGLVFRI